MFTRRLATAGLVVLGALALSAIWYLTADGKVSPDSLPAIGGAAVGALAHLLAGRKA